MNSIDRVRRKAWEVRRLVNAPLDLILHASPLLSRLEEHTGIVRQRVASGDPLLSGAQAVLNIDQGCIFQNDDLPVTTKSYDAAHEYGHWFLHNSPSKALNCECSVADLSTYADDLESLPASKVVGYSPRERRESEANLFAAEVLLPLPLAKRLFECDLLNAREIALALGIGEEIARRQLADAVLMPLPSEAESVELSPIVPLDPSQRAAAEANHGPLLLSAGPGTGKTKTLVGRCIYLTQVRGYRPETIAALTYSRKSAAEMIDRLLLAGVGNESNAPWVGTFHSFGMEVLRKYGESIGLDTNFTVIDQMDGVTLLENNLEHLDLKHLKNIKNPAYHLGGVLNNISRAKDELCSPAQFAKLAEDAYAAALSSAEAFTRREGKNTKKERDESAKALKDAEKLIDVGNCYFLYEKLKRENNLVDYGDLIGRTVELLEQFPEIRSRLHRHYQHVLADEYQDVNRASARLLRLLVGDAAEGLWVVGDHRQSIYQFQGASPANVSQFHTEYPHGHLHHLAVNYRSVEQIVTVFSEAAKALSFGSVGDHGPEWSAFRGPLAGSDSTPTITILNTSHDQYRFIKEKIEQLAESGYPLAQQAILVRTHAQAQEASHELSRLGVPSLYLGKLLDRPEIKDLIAIIAAASSGQSAALCRAAQIPEYGLTEPDALRMSKRSDTEWDGLFAKPAVAAQVQEGWNRLEEHIQHLRQYVHRPAALLRAYLFGASRYLELMKSPGLGDWGTSQNRIAIRQFLDVVESFELRTVVPTDNSSSTRADQLLNYLRRLTGYGGAVTAPDGEAIEQIQAVRILTLHSAKGLEFPVVYLPNLNDGLFPSKSPHDGIPKLPGLSTQSEEDADEDNCLFFVGLSRAKDHLYLTSFARKESGDPVGPSPLLGALEAACLSGSLSKQDLTDHGASPVLPGSDPVPTSDGVKPIFTASELDQYLRCPKRYYYKKIADVAGAEVDRGYLQFRGVVTEIVEWLEERTSTGQTSSSSERLEKLTQIWVERGPVGHVHEQLYWAAASKAAAAEVPALDGAPRPLTLTAKLKNALVHVRPDRIGLDEGKITLTRRIVGGAGGDDHLDRRLALYRQAAKDSYPKLESEVNLHYLEDGSVVPVEASPRWEPARVAKYENAVDGIVAGHYPMKPQSSDQCLSCEFLFVCPRNRREA